MSRTLAGLGLILALALTIPPVSAQDAVDLEQLKTRATAGDRNATRQLAETYYIGRGVDQDLKQAAHWYEVLAKQGDPRA